MNLDEAITYLRPIAESATVGHYAEALGLVLATAQTEPTDALEKITEVISALSINLNNEAYGKPDAEWGQIQRQLQGVELAFSALRSAFAAGQEEQS